MQMSDKHCGGIHAYSHLNLDKLLPHDSSSTLHLSLTVVIVVKYQDTSYSVV